MQEGRTDVLSRLKREKVLEIQRTRGEKKRDEWRRTEECAGRVDERRREEERIDERERGESRVGGGPDPVDTTTTTNITAATSTTTSTKQDRARNLVPTRMHRYTAGSPDSFFRTYVPLFLSLSLPCSFPALAVFISLFFHPSRSRQSAILRGNVLPIPLRRVDFLTMSLARTYCLS